MAYHINTMSKGEGMNEKLKYALILAFVLNSSLALTTFYQSTYDSYTHMFFADHYTRSWFDTWEPKWNGGFSVTTYPPLAHQVLALISFPLGLECAYQVLTLCLTLIFPLSIYKFSKIFVSDEAAGYASIISVFLPSILVITYNFGQLPTLFGLITTLLTIYYLNRYLKKGIKFDLGLAACLCGVSISTHHFTTILFLPFLTLILMSTLLRRKNDHKAVIIRFSHFLLICIIISVLILYPFIIFSMNFQMQPIPHITRTNLIADSFAFKWFFFGMYGTTLFIIPLVGLFAYNHRKLLPLFVGAIFLFILGLGGTTALPRIIFGNLWLVLTYERFALWAGITFLPLFGAFFEHHFAELKRVRFKKQILGLFFISVVISAVYFGNNPILRTTNVDLDPVVEFLDTEQNSRWRYLTLGFGDVKMQELSILTNAATIDGYYFLGRTIPILSNSGIATLDTTKFFGEHGLEVLETILDNAQTYNLRWVICNDPFYYDLLTKNGFILLFSQDNTGDGRFHGVTIWTKEGILPIDSGNTTVVGAQQISLIDYMWGIVPLSLLITSLILFISDKKLKKWKCPV